MRCGTAVAAATSRCGARPSIASECSGFAHLRRLSRRVRSRFVAISFASRAGLAGCGRPSARRAALSVVRVTRGGATPRARTPAWPRAHLREFGRRGPADGRAELLLERRLHLAAVRAAPRDDRPACGVDLARVGVVVRDVKRGEGAFVRRELVGERDDARLARPCVEVLPRGHRREVCGRGWHIGRGAGDARIHHTRRRHGPRVDASRGRRGCRCWRGARRCGCDRYHEIGRASCRERVSSPV